MVVAAAKTGSGWQGAAMMSLMPYALLKSGLPRPPRSCRGKNSDLGDGGGGGEGDRFDTLSGCGQCCIDQ